MGKIIHKDNILKLYREGKSYEEIVKILGCFIMTVHRWCNPQYQQYIKKFNKERYWKTHKPKYLYKPKKGGHPYSIKLHNFKNGRDTFAIKNNNLLKVFKYKRKPKSLRHILGIKIRKYCDAIMKKCDITVKDVLNKFGEYPKCYLTGRSIDIMQPSTYHFDHIVPKSRGGKNILENCGITVKDANQSKRDMMVDEYIQLCKEVLENFDYKVEKLPPDFTPAGVNDYTI